MRSLRFAAPLLLGLSCLAAPAVTQAQPLVGVTVTVVPPALPVYAQPPMPGIGYVWTPGYWGWGAAGYYWVPGTWVMPPAPGLYWTPGYWAWQNATYLWIPGYWGPQVGFYGGIDYGFGYFGSGFVGGEWRGGRWFYNRGYNNFGHFHVADVYYHPVNVHASYVSYNGGAGGIGMRPTAAQEAFAHGQHMPPTAMQMQHAQAAAGNRDFLASVNHGRPAVAATSEPGHFSGPGVMGARAAGGAYHPAGAPAAHGPTPAPMHGSAPAPMHGSGPAQMHGPTPAPMRGPGPAQIHGAAPMHGPAPAYHGPAEHGPAPAYHAPAEHRPAPAAHPAAREGDRRDQHQ